MACFLASLGSYEAGIIDDILDRNEGGDDDDSDEGM